MPDNTISVADFLTQTTDDVNSPTTSNFVNHLTACRNTVTTLEEVGLLRMLTYVVSVLCHSYVHALLVTLHTIVNKLG